jgi:DnaJ-class molecular chaperone
MEDVYKYFGINKKASKDEIKKAYRKKAKKQHPDVSNGEDFNKTINYYKLLIDDRSRAEYDETGEMPGKQPQNEEYQMAVDYFMSACLSSDPVHENIIEKAKENIKTVIFRENNEIEKVDQTKANLQKVMDRLKIKEGDDIIKIHIESIIRSNDIVVIQKKNLIASLEKAMALLDNYIYMTDASTRAFLNYMPTTATSFFSAGGY